MDLLTLIVKKYDFEFVLIINGFAVDDHSIVEVVLTDRDAEEMGRLTLHDPRNSLTPYQICGLEVR